MTRIDIWLGKVNYWVVISLALLVPAVDRSVNVLVFMLAVFVSIRFLINSRNIVERIDSIDWCMFLLLLSAVLSTALGWPAEGIHGILEGIAYLTLFICIRHGGYGVSQLRWMGMAIVCGTLIAVALAWGKHVGSDAPFDLGGINGTIRSSIYTGIALMLCFGLALDAFGIRRFILISILLILFLAMTLLISRAVIVALLISMFIGLFARYRWRAIYAGLLLLTVISFSKLFLPQQAQDRFEYKTKELTELVFSGKLSNNDLARVEYWRVANAWIGRGEHVLFGIGPRNYHLIDAEKLELSEPLRFAEDTRHPVHAHNMYITRYVEQGLFGLVVMLALFVLIARLLIHDGIVRHIDWTWWGALGGLLLPGINGIVGSPWYREHAWLAVFTFALYLAWKSGASKQHLTR